MAKGSSGGGEALPLVALVPLRVLTGLIFLSSGIAKVQGGFVARHELSRHVEAALVDGAPYVWYARFLREIVLPHATLFSYLVIAGELVIGAGLVLGLFSRPLALGGLLMMIAICLERGALFAPTSPVAFGLIFLTLLLCGGGRAMGLDARLRGKLPAWLV